MTRLNFILPDVRFSHFRWGRFSKSKEVSKGRQHFYKAFVNYVWRLSERVVMVIIVVVEDN